MTRTTDYALCITQPHRAYLSRRFQPADCADIEQEAVISLWKADVAGKLPDDESERKRYVWTILRRRCTDHLRDKYSRPERPSEGMDQVVARTVEADAVDATELVQRLLPAAGQSRAAVERWMAGEQLTQVRDRMRVSRGLRRIRKVAGMSVTD